MKNTFKIICKSCSKILNYFIAYDFLNTSNIKKHFKFSFYLKRKKSKSQNTINLTFSYISLDR